GLLLARLICWSWIFFFQAEDGIRDFHVTGVQTCALPILTKAKFSRQDLRTSSLRKMLCALQFVLLLTGAASLGQTLSFSASGARSEEHTSELQSRENLVCRLLLEKKKEHPPAAHIDPPEL